MTLKELANCRIQLTADGQFYQPSTAHFRLFPPVPFLGFDLCWGGVVVA